jgi:hypothetical protein
MRTGGHEQGRIVIPGEYCDMKSSMNAAVLLFFF